MPVVHSLNHCSQMHSIPGPVIASGDTVPLCRTGGMLYSPPPRHGPFPGLRADKHANKINTKCSWLEDTATLPAQAVLHSPVFSVSILSTSYVPSTMLNMDMWNWIMSGSPGIISPEKEVSEEYRSLSCVLPS